MILYIKDRIFLPQMLPENNSFLEYNLKQNILKKVALTEEDIEKYEIKEDAENKRTTWSHEKDVANPIEVKFDTQELKYLKEACQKTIDSHHPDDFWITVDKVYSETE